MQAQMQAQIAESKVFSSTLDCKVALSTYKIYDVVGFQDFTLTLDISKTSAIGDGRIAVRGYLDAAQRHATQDLALLDLNSTTSAKLNAIPISAGSTKDTYVFQLKEVNFTALEIYVKTADTGTSISAKISILATGLRTDAITAEEQAVTLRRRLGKVATRIPFMLTSPVTNTTQNTYRVYTETSAPFKRVRPIFINTSLTQAYTVTACSAHAVPNADVLNLSTYPSATVPIPNGGAVPVASEAYTGANFVFGDWVDLASVPLSDGQKGGMVCFSAYVSESAMLSGCGVATSGISGWATRNNQKHKLLQQAGNLVATPQSFTNTSLRERTIFAGIQYESEESVLTTFAMGDSISYGSYATILGDSFVSRCIDLLEEAGGAVAIEQVNLGDPENLMKIIWPAQRM